MSWLVERRVLWSCEAVERALLNDTLEISESEISNVF